MALGLSRNSASSDFSNTSQMGEKKKQPIKSWFWCSSEGNLSPQLAPSTSGTQTPSPEPGVPHSRAHGWLRTTGFGAFQACWFWHQQILRQNSTSSWIFHPSSLQGISKFSCSVDEIQVTSNFIQTISALVTASALNYWYLNSTHSQIWSGSK